MSTTIQTGAVHHVTLTVSDLRRSQPFYTELLGFNFVTDFGPKALLVQSQRQRIFALNPPSDPAQAIPADQFTENRIGLNHLSLSVASMADLQAAAGMLDARSVSYVETRTERSRSSKPLEPFGIAVLAFLDPDDIQVELTASFG